MKKNLFIALLMAIVAIPASAQFKWGVEAGLNMNKLTTSKMSDHKLGFFVGPKVQFGFGGIIIDGSLQYSQTTADIQDIKSKTLPYIVVPVNFKYAIGLGSFASVYLSTGPQWNWYVGKNSELHISTPEGEQTGFFTIPESTLNWNVGAGVHLAKHFQVGVTYSIALQDNTKIGWNTAGDVAGNLFSGKSKNNIWQVRLAYMF